MDDFKIVALVDATNWRGLVLNRKPELKYRREGMNYVGEDGPFKRVFYYSSHKGAFAGSPFTLPMEDGSTVEIKDNWWHGATAGYQDIAISTVEELSKCYVFGGGMCIRPDDLARLISEYTGPAYPYWDYHKIITYDQMRRDLLQRLFRQERISRSLRKEAKRQCARADALAAMKGEG